MSDDVVKAPWTPEQVQSLWAYQTESCLHPFTCGNRDENHPVMLGDNGVLVPTTRGWVCMFCDYTQDWAHKMMTTYLQGQRGAVSSVEC